MAAEDPTADRVHLFGGPRLTRAGRPLPLSPAQMALLALAYGSGPEGIGRAEAAWLLWEADDTPHVRHRMSQLLYAVRKRVGRLCLEEGPSEVIRGGLPSDYAEFLESHRERRLEDLEAAARETFLAELAPPTPSFSHWIDRRRARVRTLVRELCAAELGAAEARGDWERTLLASRLLLALDPDDEPMLRRLLMACALGRSRLEVDAALRSYGEAYRTHHGERWSPARETLELLRRIDQIEIGAPAPEQAATPRFVGRGSEQRLLHEALARVPGTVEFAVVAGEAGIGKTRLIQETLARLRLAGRAVLESTSSPLQRDLPLHALLGALSERQVLQHLQEMEEPWRSALMMVLPELPLGAPVSPPMLDPQASSRRLMEALYQLLRRVTAAGPTILFLDDLQWVDKTTLSAIEFICERSPPPSLTVVFALRPEGEQDPVTRTFLDLVRRSGTWIELDELEPEAADALIQEAAPAPLSASEKARLRQVAGRNPFFLIELANDYCRSGGDPEDAERPERVPSSVRQLIANRMDGLSREARTLLQLLSVIGPMRLDVPLEIEEVPQAYLADVADDLLRARLIQHEAGRISIRHDLIRQAAYELMGPIKRSVLHRRAAEAVVGRLGNAASGEAAIHFDRAGDRRAAHQHAFRAASAAQATGAVPEAIRFWEMARRNASTPEETAAATAGMAELLYEARRIEEAVPLLEAAELTGESGQGERFALMRLDALSELPGAEQEKYLHEVAAVAERTARLGRWDRYAEAMEVKLRILDRLNRTDDIRRELEQVQNLQSSGVITSPYASCLVHTILAISILYFDDDAGIAAADVALRLAREHKLQRLLLRAYQRQLFYHVLRGTLDSRSGQEATKAALEQAARSGDIKSRSNIYNVVGCFYLDTGDYPRAEKHLRDAEALVCGPSERTLIMNNLGELLYCRGEYSEAENYYRKAVLEAEKQPVSGFIRPAASAGLGLCALATGRMSAALAHEEPVREALETWIHDPYLLVRFLAELDRRRGRVSSAIRLIRERAVYDVRRPTYWIKVKLLEARYLKPVDPAGATKVLEEVSEEARKRGLERMLLANL